MNRITENLADLVNDGSDSDVDDDITDASSVNNKKKKKSNNTSNSSSSRLGGTGQHYRQIIVVVSLVAIIIGASLAIGYTVVNNTSSESSYLMANNNKEDEQEQKLLEIAERVITACSEDKLNEDMKECQSLCHSRLCCFEESGSDYSCQLDTSKNCAVYAGCEALVEGILVGGAEEDEA